VLSSHTILHVGKQVVVTRSEIRAVRGVVKWLPVEMLQQCSSVSSCMWTCIVMEEHHTGCQHSMPFGLNGTMQFLFFFFIFLARNTLVTLWSLVVWILLSALVSCPRKQVLLAFWQSTFV
jgi:hypothetical protein